MSEKTSSGTATSQQRPAASSSERDQAALALKSSVVEGAHDVTEGVKHLAGDMTGQVRKSAESQLNQGKNRAADGLGGIADALRRTGEQLRAEEKVGFTEYLDRAAHHVDVASGYLQNRSISQVIGDVETFARREPALFLGGAFVAGLIGGRFLKSSARPSEGASVGGQAQSFGGQGRHNNNNTRGTQMGGPQRGEGTRESRPRHDQSQPQPQSQSSSGETRGDNSGRGGGAGQKEQAQKGGQTPPTNRTTANATSQSSPSQSSPYGSSSSGSDASSKTGGNADVGGNGTKTNGSTDKSGGSKSSGAV